MSDYTCEIKGMDQALTVGQIFEFNCKGPFPVGFKFQQATVTGLQDKYTLKLLKFEMRDLETAQIKLTSYSVGQQKLDKIQITDGEKTLEFPGVQFQVNSVLPPPEGGTQQQPPKPFGPFGPMKIPVPPVYWLILISVIGIMAFAFALKWKRRRDRLDVLQEIKNRTKGPTPVVQFHRDLRILTRKAGVQDHQLLIDPKVYLKELRLITETFWGQKFKVALLDQPSDRLEKEFKHYAPKAYIKFKEELKFWNRRWQSLNTSTQQAKVEDFITFTANTRGFVERMAEEEI
jgi:hypothetical protein